MKSETQQQTSATSSATDRSDLRAQIEIRARKLWLADGCRHGNHLNHWLQAERELMNSHPGPRNKID